MKRQRQCTTWSCFEINVRCQRIARHEGPHAASTRPTVERHWSWADGAPTEVELLPGTVWFHRPAPSRAGRVARRLGEWAAIVPGALLLWWLTSPGTTVTFIVLELLLSVRRARFFDVGRFTAGIWPAGPAELPLIFGIAWAVHGEGRSAKKAGLQLTLGGTTVGVFSLAPRREWAAFKRAQAAARQGGGR
ncbi:hypothetical protein [Streptomyces hirsutus]|uniref:hypothetical protein n=1 Tax=Streptomyces hirsutus TaxID=35620 RepID=UPI00332A2164